MTQEGLSAVLSDSMVEDKDTDALLSDRFDRRMRTAALFLIPLHACAIVVNTFIDGHVLAAAFHLCMAGLAWMIARRSRDAVRTIIFSHVYWTFSFMTYLFAATHLQAPSYGLGDPERSALVALVAQAGLFVAFLLSPSDPALPSRLKEQYRERNGLVTRAQWLLIAAGIVGMVARISGGADAFNATLILLLYVALSLRIARNAGHLLKDPVIWVTFCALAYMSIATNERTDIMAMLLLVSFALVMTQKRLLTWKNALIAYVSWRLLYVFSSVSIAIRWARNSGQSLFDLFTSHFFTADTFWALVNPLHLHQADILYNATARRSGFYSEFLGSVTDLGGRLTVLPQMDIVVSRWPEATMARWDELWAIVLSALPSLGQTKSLIFSDEVVWELGLRGRETIGRPMITAVGELYVIGGYGAILLVIPFCFWVMHWGYRLIARTIGSRVAAILVMSQLFINTVFSTTILSVIIGTIRMPLQLVALLAITALVVGATSRRERVRLPA